MLDEKTNIGQDQPLLDQNSEYREEEQNKIKTDNTRTATFTTTVLNLCNNIVGAGILSLPHSFMDASIIGATMLLLVTCFLSAVSMVLLGFSCKVTKTDNFYSLTVALVGPKFSFMLQIFLWMYTFLSGIAFLILIGDFLSGETGLLPSLCSPKCNENVIYKLFSHRKVVVILVTLTILFPLCLKRNLSALRNTSLLSFVSMIYLTGFMIFKYTQQTDKELNLNYFVLSSKFFRAAPIVNVAYICHYNSPKYFQEFHSDSMTDFSVAVFFAFALCSVVYFLVGLFGYMLFGNAVLGDVLVNFRGNTFDILLAKLCLTLTVMFTYPLAFNAFRLSAFRVIGKCVKDAEFNAFYFNISTSLLILCTLIPGLLLNDIAVVLDYKGSTLGGLIGFGLTGIFLYQLTVYYPESIKYSKLAKLSSCVFISWCLVTSVLGVYVTTSSLLHDDT